MSLYAISDLHLAISNMDKSMEVFGDKWENYIERLKENWGQTVDEDDVILLPGDFCWATYLKDAYEDFAFLDALNGKKIVSKGNHDYWWTTTNKLIENMEENGFKSVEFLNNNSFKYKNIAICGTRGWICPDSEGFTQEDKKIYARELIRLDLSLKSAINAEKRIVMLHYPPLMQDGNPDIGFLEIMQKYGVELCIFGHLHGSRNGWVEGVKCGIEFKLVASDYLGFKPLKLFD